MNLFGMVGNNLASKLDFRGLQGPWNSGYPLRSLPFVPSPTPKSSAPAGDESPSSLFPDHYPESHPIGKKLCFTLIEGRLEEKEWEEGTPVGTALDILGQIFTEGEDMPPARFWEIYCYCDVFLIDWRNDNVAYVNSFKWLAESKVLLLANVYTFDTAERGQLADVFLAGHNEHLKRRERTRLALTCKDKCKSMVKNVNDSNL